MQKEICNVHQTYTKVRLITLKGTYTVHNPADSIYKIQPATLPIFAKEICFL